MPVCKNSASGFAVSLFRRPATFFPDTFSRRHVTVGWHAGVDESAIPIQMRADFFVIRPARLASSTLHPTPKYQALASTNI